MTAPVEIKEAAVAATATFVVEGIRHILEGLDHVLFLIGIQHGFGFSFMLHNILRVDAPNVWQSLLAFNIGVEVGQLLIVAAIWPIVMFLRSRPPPVWRLASVGTAAAASVIAAIWVVQRAAELLA